MNDDPASARPPGKLYLFRKLLRRHKVAFSAAATQRLGQSQQAPVERARARELLAGPFNRDVSSPRGEGNGLWFDWVIARVLERETTALVEGSAR